MKSGYYRVRYNKIWRIAEYSEITHKWLLIGISWRYIEKDFDKDPNGKPMIDETMINPES